MAGEDRERHFEKALARNLCSDRPDETRACPDAELLAAYHDRSLSREEMISWKEHIAGCPRCQQILAQLEVTDELLPADAAARKPLEQALRLSKAAMTEGRRALNDLRTQRVGSEDLLRAFAQVANDFPEREAPLVDVLTEGEERPLNAVAGEDVLQIGRQAIANAL